MSEFSVPRLALYEPGAGDKAAVLGEYRLRRAVGRTPTEAMGELADHLAHEHTLTALRVDYLVDVRALRRYAAARDYQDAISDRGMRGEGRGRFWLTGKTRKGARV
ncbi:MAG TPA: hypothetical protein VFW64_12440 [Pseudonocardiaceae bacterium]|nr:hypothetical protein [Pseudonocardiaceae bacterium]